MLRCHYPTEEYNPDPVYSESIPELAQESYKLENFWYDFQRVIRRELETFEILMDMLFTNEEYIIPEGVKRTKELMLSKHWRKLAEYEVESENFLLKDTRSIEERIASNPVLSQVLPLISDLEPIRQHLMKTWVTYTDIYGQDMYNYTFIGREHKYNQVECGCLYRKPLVLTLDGKYLAHIYRMGGHTSLSTKLEFIGIRESWENTFNKLYFNCGFRNVGYHVLKACRMVCKKCYPNCTSIVLNDAIGPMACIASNYGFKYAEEMKLVEKPKVATQKIYFL